MNPYPQRIIQGTTNNEFIIITLAEQGALSKTYLGYQQIALEYSCPLYYFHLKMQKSLLALLQNFLCDKAPLRYTRPRSFDVQNLRRTELQHGDRRSGLSSQDGGLGSVKVVGRNNYKSTSKTREKFSNYFNISLIHCTEQYRGETNS